MAKAPFLEKIRQKPHAEKVRLIWIISIVTVALLVIIWVAVGQAPRPTEDSGIFGTISRGWQDVKNSYHNAFNKNSDKIINDNSNASGNNAGNANSGAY